jgi:hypothetical protein
LEEAGEWGMGSVMVLKRFEAGGVEAKVGEVG